ncbi:MAG: N-acetylmuramoyl-L-alanine amidase, partial [Phascolarctobacterium sp.]|nr:N-acetylmuramoyl-L-alanine amidase [Phascolarctobacterium sp.]
MTSSKFKITLSARDFVVVIDAGHGGHDGGAVGVYAKEKDINLAVAKA